MAHAVSHRIFHMAALIVFLAHVQSALCGIEFSEQPWHQRITLWIICFQTSFDLILDFHISFFFTLSERILKEIFSPSLFGGLLLEDIRE